MLLAGVLTLIYLIFTWSINSCATLRPLASLFFSVPLVLVWIVGFSLLTNDVYGTLGHSCTTSNWGNATGVMVCNIYKLFYSFVLFALLSQIALVIIDIRARIEQNRSGAYDRMSRLQEGLKLDTLRDSGMTPTPEVLYGVDVDGPLRPGVTPDESAYQPVPAPAVYPPADNFYQQSHKANRSRGDSYRSESSLVDNGYGRPALYSRGGSLHQSSRSDVPMLPEYNYYSDYHGGSNYSSRQHSPYRRS